MAKEEKGSSFLRAFKQGGSSRKFTIELSLAGLVTLSVAVVLGLIWVFILGVLLGRGYKPEKAVPEITKVLPGGESQVAEAPRPEVLKPEDLEFHNRVRQDPPSALPPQPEPKPLPLPAQQPTPATPAQPAVQQPGPTVTPKPTQPEAASGPRYKYVYQVASFKESDRAQALKKQITDQGLASSIETAEIKGTPWYRVLVNVTGTQAEAQAAEEALVKSGLPKPMLRRKTALQ